MVDGWFWERSIISFRVYQGCLSSGGSAFPNAYEAILFGSLFFSMAYWAISARSVMLFGGDRPSFLRPFLILQLRSFADGYPALMDRPLPQNSMGLCFIMVVPKFRNESHVKGCSLPCVNRHNICINAILRQYYIRSC